MHQINIRDTLTSSYKRDGHSRWQMGKEDGKMTRSIHCVRLASATNAHIGTSSNSEEYSVRMKTTYFATKTRNG